MLSQFTQIQEDLLALKQEFIEGQLSPSPDQDSPAWSSLSTPLQKLPF